MVIAGNPAKIIFTLDEYFEKRKARWVSDAKQCALEIYRQTGRRPTVDEMKDGFYWLYAPRTQESIESKKEFFTLSGDDYENICECFLQSEPVYASFEEFLKDCGLRE